VVADAAALPFAGSPFDLAVAYNVLMDFDDLAASLQEVARLTHTRGTACRQCSPSDVSSWEFDSGEPDARFAIDGSYFEQRDY
jgi:ubiquinone/menaquinone biosynthesis C-methylase UbiE